MGCGKRGVMIDDWTSLLRRVLEMIPLRDHTIMNTVLSELERQ